MKPMVGILAFLFLIGLGVSAVIPNNSSPVPVQYDHPDNPITVLDVAADPDVPGRVFAITGTYLVAQCFQFQTDQSCTIDTSPERKLRVHESTDYGKTWAEFPLEIGGDSQNPNIQRFQRFRPGRSYDWPIESDFYGRLFFREGRLSSRPIWQVPIAQMLREGHLYTLDFNFITNSAGYNRMEIRPVNSVAREDKSTIYIGLKEYGVLIGPNPAYPELANRGWLLTDAMLSPDDPNAPPRDITITNFLFALALLLFLPPLPYLNYLLMKQAYRYAFQPGEDKPLRRYTRLISGIAMLAYVIPLTFALTRQDVDFKAAMILLGVLNVIIGAAGGWWISRKRGFTTAFTRKMTIGSGMLALAVPAGLLGGTLVWCVILASLCAFLATRTVISRFLEHEGGVSSRWGVDRLSLEIMIVYYTLLVPVAILLSLIVGTFTNFGRLRVSELSFVFLPIGLCILILALCASSMIKYLKFRVETGLWLVKKKAAQAGDMQAADRRLWRGLFGYTWAGLIVASALCACLLWAQSLAPAWYRMLQGF
jgi:hypothetical protein